MDAATHLGCLKEKRREIMQTHKERGGDCLSMALSCDLIDNCRLDLGTAVLRVWIYLYGILYNYDAVIELLLHLYLYGLWVRLTNTY